MGSVSACVRYLLFFFNLIFALTGIAVLVVGCILQFSLADHKFSKFWDDTYVYLVPIALITIGVIIAVIAFFGCCGSMKESHCMLFSFGLLLIALFFVEIAAVGTGYYFRNTLVEKVESTLQEGVNNYRDDTDAMKVMDGIQTDLHCCGTHGPTDYSGFVPNSCCSNFPSEETCSVTDAYQLGCLNAIQWNLTDASMIFLSIAGGVAIVQLIGIIFAFCLARSIKRGYEIV